MYVFSVSICVFDVPVSVLGVPGCLGVFMCVAV